MKSLMTLVIPCFNEAEALPLFMDAVKPIRDELVKEEVSTELIFIDDGSSDSTLSLLRGYHSADETVRYVSFSRNFGKEAGIYAGLKESKGDYVVLLDADLQHPVEYIPVMYHAVEGEGLDSAAMYRVHRKGDGIFRSFFSKRFFRLLNKLSHLDLVDGATDYRLMSRKMVDAVLSMKEYNRFSKGIFNWVGFSTKWLPYTDVARSAGKSKWSRRGLLHYGLEGMFAFSTAPLTISFSLGVILCVLAILYAIFTVVKTLVFGDPVAGFPSIFTMILLLGGIQLLFLGILGQYMSRMYLETKNRPIYIEKEKT